MSRTPLILVALLLAGCGKPQYPAPYVFAPSPAPPAHKPTPTPTPIVGKWATIQEQRWNTAQTRPEKAHFAQAIAVAVKRGQSRYEAVQRRTGVPWKIIGCLHYRESDLDFKTHLFNGDPLTAKTRHEPIGQPKGNPPFSWEYSAEQSMLYDKLNVAIWSDIGATLDNVERFNGTGYRKYGIVSPYIASWTGLYSRGKFIADGQFSSTAVDAQSGVIPIMKYLQ